MLGVDHVARLAGAPLPLADENVVSNDVTQQCFYNTLEKLLESELSRNKFFINFYFQIKPC